MRAQNNLIDIEKFLDEKFQELEAEHFSKWQDSKEKSITIILVGGGNLQHQGDFNEEIKARFWNSNYIPEYIEKYCFEILDQIEELSENPEIKLKKNRELKRCKKEFKKFINKIYARMQDVESELLSKSLSPNYTKNISRIILDTRKDTYATINSYKTSMFGDLFGGEIDNEASNLGQIFKYKKQLIKILIILVVLYLASTYIPRLFS